jgi:hypothetical protein
MLVDVAIAVLVGTSLPSSLLQTQEMCGTAWPILTVGLVECLHRSAIADMAVCHR